VSSERLRLAQQLADLLQRAGREQRQEEQED
jgi:hypothetical protein